MLAKTRGGRGLLFALVGLSMLAAGPSWAQQAEVTFDVGRLPRVTGAKEIYASPATTIFTSPETVTQTAETLGKTLAAGGWQQYSPPLSATSDNESQRILSFKKGTQALGVFITVAPAQGNATSVQYTAVALKTDLPFPADASQIEYSPDRPLLTLLTAEPIDKTLDFYRKELGARGWSLWSQKTNAKQPDGGPSGTVYGRGGYAHYITDRDPSITLVVTLQKTDAGPVKVELKQWPLSILASMHQAYLTGGTNLATLVDVAALPRLDGANVTRSAPDRLSYVVPGSLAKTIAATRALLAADGWKPYVVPLDEVHERSLTLKKDGQGLSLFFTSPRGAVEQTGIDFSPARLGFALPFPDDATDIVFHDNRPYLNLVTAGTVDATRDFFNTQLLASGWSPLSAADAAAKWPNAKLDEAAANGALAYYISENQRPVVLSLQRRDDGKTQAEIKLPPFALPQTLDVGEEIYGMPRPKQAPNAGGTRSETVHEMHAQVPAEVGTVLAFYRRELAARNWKEEAKGAVVTPDQVVLNFTPAEGTAVLKLNQKYGMTVVSLVRQLPKPVAKAEPAGNSIDAMMKQAQQMARDAGVDIAAVTKPPRMVQGATGPQEALRPRAGSDAPVPLPDTANDVDIGDGKLEFTTESSVQSVADFYRTTMKQQGWQAQSSVINNANMVVLNFSKARKPVSFTIMRMGAKTNVSADGPGLKMAAAKPNEPGTPSGKAPVADAPVQASAEDLEVEQSGGLPVPKRHSLAVGTQTSFRRELNANTVLDLATVLAFYRRELGKIDWKEKSPNPPAKPDSAALTFSSPEGPALLKLGRKDGETTVSIIVRNADAATKAGVLPKSGQVKLLISNPSESDAVLTINKKTVTAAAGVGMKTPDGPVIDLPPGKYKFTIKVTGQPASTDEIKVGADETWGLLIGPGSALPMQVY